VADPREGRLLDDSKLVSLLKASLSPYCYRLSGAVFTATTSRLDVVMSRELVRDVHQVAKVYFLFTIYWHIEPLLGNDYERNN
jgi:hypothetical protein